jgi:hypothetical protein
MKAAGLENPLFAAQVAEARALAREAAGHQR